MDRSFCRSGDCPSRAVMTFYRRITIVLLLFVMIAPSFSQEKIDENINTLIRKYGLEESEVMDIAAWLTDV